MLGSRELDEGDQNDVASFEQSIDVENPPNRSPSIEACNVTLFDPGLDLDTPKFQSSLNSV